MNEKNKIDIDGLKKILQYLKVARLSDHVTFQAMLSGDNFKKAAITPLEKMAGWNEKDEEMIGQLARKFKEETRGKTLKEKSDKLSKMLKIGGAAVVGLSIAGGIAYLWKNKKDKTEK